MNMKKLLPAIALSLVLLPLFAMAADTEIVQKHQHFDREEITIKAGDKLVMKNDDTVKHNIVVISQDGDSDDKGIQKPGEDITVPFTAPGVYKVRCNIHSTMKLNVTVQ
jgi:plastocyanin